MSDFSDKASRVICSCKTVEQLDVAQKYIKLALKSNRIGSNGYHFLWGTINALRGVLKANENIKTGDEK